MQKPLRILYCCIAILLIPAFLINLDLLAFIDDEAIRSMVAFEMWKTGNLIVPTIHGEWYLNKPPLYNWIILLFIKAFGVANEWTARLPTLLFLGLFCLSIYQYLKSHFSPRFSLFIAFIFLTCGRILFWDSFLGLIDICFSWIIFLLFIGIYHFGQEAKWRFFWPVIYLLTAVAFLLKGIPALVFGFLSTGMYLIYYRQLRQLFHPAHLIGISIFLFLVGGYYYLYAAQAGGLSVIFGRLIEESSKRTVVQFGWLHTLKHLGTFPFEMLYHFLPWSLLSLALIRKDLIKSIKSHPFVLYCALIFAVNIPVYWSAPQVYPRYLLMLVPVYFTIISYLAVVDLQQLNLRSKILQYAYLLVGGILLVGVFVPLFYMDLALMVPFLYWKSFPIIIAMSVAFYFGLKWKIYRGEILIVQLLIARIAFDLFVMPDRVGHDIGALSRREAKVVGAKYVNKPLKIAGEQSKELMAMFYFSTEAEQVIPVDNSPINAGAYYIVDSTFIRSANIRVLDSFHVRSDRARRFVISK